MPNHSLPAFCHPDKKPAIKPATKSAKSPAKKPAKSPTTRPTMAGNSYPDWLVVFCNQSRYPWQQLLRSGFRHCFFITHLTPPPMHQPSRHQSLMHQPPLYLLCDALAPKLQLRLLPTQHNLLQLQRYYQQLGCAVVAGRQPNRQAVQLKPGQLKPGQFKPRRSKKLGKIFAAILRQTPRQTLGQIIVKLGRVSTNFLWFMARLVPFYGFYSCVGLVKQFLQINNPMIITPYQLYQFLQRRPNYF